MPLTFWFLIKRYDNKLVEKFSGEVVETEMAKEVPKLEDNLDAKESFQSDQVRF